ncbi:MAG: hypothetical protein K8R02_06855 [Anaerohalosphaeraceae bacterium]|nr:hypothetical protein [Anaerohalosphaeraceae bacterium]
MYLRRLFVFVAVCGFCFSAFAEQTAEDLSSALIARSLYEIGYELYSDVSAEMPQARQALVFFNAAMSLDPRGDYVLPEVINIAWKYPQEDYGDAISLALNQYINRSCDLETASKGISYLLERQNSREEREKVLETLLGRYAKRNSCLASDLYTRLGLLRIETADFTMAQQLFTQAYSLDKYNRLAFLKLAELSETNASPLPEYVYLQNLRNAVTAGPLDFESAFNFGQYADSLSLFAPAAAAYKYCVDLNHYLTASGRIEPGLYLPWILSCYNAGKYNDCHKIVKAVRLQGDYDVMAEAIAAAAAMKSSDQETLGTILNDIEVRSEKILSGKMAATGADYEKFAWFFTFLSDSNSSDILTWATKAYEAEPNSPNAASLFAYALVLNSQNELAESVLAGITKPTQISAFASGRLLAEKDVAAAVELLESAIAAAPGTFEAGKANTFLETIGSKYTPFIEPAVLVTALKSDYGRRFFSNFVPPRDMISLKFSTKGSVFSYGSEIQGELAVINNYSEPLVISSESVFTGRIRIDAKISGDVSLDVPELITKTVRPSENIRPGDALFFKFNLVTGKVLKALNHRWPQAEVKIEYTVYIDPIVSADETVKNALAIPPAKVVIKRRRLDLTTKYLQQRLDALSKGHQGQKIKSAQLFAGLLSEQQEMAKYGKSLYRLKYAEPQLLTSAISKCIAEDDWVLKTQSIAAVLGLRCDWRLTKAVSDELDNPNWPVRLMAFYVLSKNADEKFKPVLQWAANYEQNEMVKNMANLLLADFDKTVATETVGQ